MTRVAILILAVMFGPQSTTQTPPPQQMPAPGTPRWQPPDPTNLQGPAEGHPEAAADPNDARVHDGPRRAVRALSRR